MELPPLADLDDVEAVLGAKVDNPDYGEWLIRYASSLVRRETGCTFVDADNTLLDTPAVHDVRDVVIGMIKRAVDNPEGVTQDTTGPFTVSFGSDAAQRVYLIAGDRIVLAALRCRGGLWTLPTTRGPIEAASVHVPPTGLPLASGTFD